MALLLAPYNDSMRLGMGFNSYTQSLCIDRAVTISKSDLIHTNNPSQVVTYSSKFVEHLSEVVSSMQVSHSSSIKRGTVEIAGNGDSINEDKIKASDVNAVISVKVVNQTVVSGDNATFSPMAGVFPGTTDFNDKFGDCYISGFITGGEFNGVVSMRVIDRSKTASVVSSIKKNSRSGKSADFMLDMDSSFSSSLDSKALKDTETTITVSWMGGGQVKEPTTAWTLDSVYAAADAFPARVAKKPQLTWAILTKYKANRTFVAQTNKLAFSPLEYDLVAGFTSTLFDNYMDYKSLVKAVQDMMTSPSKYEMVTQANAITLDVDTLVAVQAAFRTEMNKIVQAVDILTKDPHILKRSRKIMSEPTNDTVAKIIANATKNVGAKEQDAFWNWQPEEDAPFEALDQSTFDWAPLPESEQPKQVASAKTASIIPEAVPKQQSQQSTAAKSTTQSQQTTTKAQQAATKAEPTAHEQWVWVAAGAKPDPNYDQIPQKDKSARPSGWYPAWVENTARVFDFDKVPIVEFIEGTGDTALAWIEAFKGYAATANGSWEVGSVYDNAQSSAGSETTADSTKASGKSNDGGRNFTEPTTTANIGQKDGTTTTVDKKQPATAKGEPTAKIANATEQTPTDTGSETSSKGQLTPSSGATESIGATDTSLESERAVERQSARHQEPRRPIRKTEKLPTINFDLMISPQIWRSVLPKAVDGSPLSQSAEISKMPTSIANKFPAAPTGEVQDLNERVTNKPSATLEVLSAVCGVIDCTDALRDWIKPDNTLTVDTTKISDLLVARSPQPKSLTMLQLSFVYRYTGQPMRLCVTCTTNTSRTYDITPTATEFPILTPTDWTIDTWSVAAVVYGGKQYTDAQPVTRVLGEIKKNFDGGNGIRSVNITNDLVQNDPLVGYEKASVLFYQIKSGGQLRCAAGLEHGAPCVLSDSAVSPDDAAAKKDLESVRKELEETKKQLESAKGDVEAAKSSQLEASRKTEWMTNTWKLSQVPTYDQATDRDNNLSPDWNGKKMQLAHAVTMTFLDHAPQDYTYLYRDNAFFAHDNEAVTFVRASMIDYGEGWNILCANNCALEMQNNRIVKRPFNPSEELQRWYIAKSPDSFFRLRIRTKRWNDCFIMAYPDRLPELHGTCLPNDIPNDPFGLMAFAGTHTAIPPRKMEYYEFYPMLI